MLDTLNLVPPVVLLYFFCTPSLSVLAFAHPPTLAKSRVADRMGLGCYLLSLLFVGEPETSSHCPALGPGGARRSGEFHRHRGVQLGAGALWAHSTLARSWPGSGQRCTPPSRSARQRAPAYTPPTASRRSRSTSVFPSFGDGSVLSVSLFTRKGSP
jgi:hypothetical protein